MIKSSYTPAGRQIIDVIEMAKIVRDSMPFIEKKKQEEAKKRQAKLDRLSRMLGGHV